MSKGKGKIDPLPPRDLTMFDPERIASELEEASKEMDAFYGLKIPGMSIMFEDEEGSI
jgi:hypothetical protein